MKLDAATIRRVLAREKRKLRERRQQDLEENRARYSAASEDSVSRVLMLEELLESHEGE
jgi:hypothetical protein